MALGSRWSQTGLNNALLIKWRAESKLSLRGSLNSRDDSVGHEDPEQAEKYKIQFCGGKTGDSWNK